MMIRIWYPLGVTLHEYTRGGGGGLEVCTIAQQTGLDIAGGDDINTNVLCVLNNKWYCIASRATKLFFAGEGWGMSCIQY